MKSFITLLVYAVVSGLVGLITCIVLFRGGKRRLGWIAALVFLGGPVCGYLYLEVSASLRAKEFEEDVAYVKELCAKYGGDKIYRTVEDVQGVYQITPKRKIAPAMWRDQYGMQDPWNRAMLDSENPAIPIGPASGIEGSNGFWFLEQKNVEEGGAPFVRRFSSSRYEAGTPIREIHSKYGYLTVDISTSDMRSRWIGGGTVKIIDLQTNQILAERTGYFRALGPEYQDAWGGVSGTNHICPSTGNIGSFLIRVLKPPKDGPSIQELHSLTRE